MGFKKLQLGIQINILFFRILLFGDGGQFILLESLLLIFFKIVNLHLDGFFV